MSATTVEAPRLGLGISNEVPVAETACSSDWPSRLASRRRGSRGQPRSDSDERRGAPGGRDLLHRAWDRCHQHVLAPPVTHRDGDRDARRDDWRPAADGYRSRGMVAPSPRRGRPAHGRPLTATVDTLRIVAGMLQGRTTPGSGLFPVRPDTRLSFEPVRHRVPLYVGAVNRRMLEASGAWADGVALGAITSPGYARWAADTG